MRFAFWTQKTGEEILVADMANSHVRNTIKMLERQVNRIEKELEYIYSGDLTLEDKFRASIYKDRIILKKDWINIFNYELKVRGVPRY